MTSSFRQSKQIALLKALWLLVTGGAFVSLAGGALTLMYFWSIGGVPVGQASSAGALAKVVLPTALLFVVVFLTIWLAPTMMSSVFIDEKEFTQTLRRLFTNSDRIAKHVNESPAGTQCEGVHGDEQTIPPETHPSTRWEVVADVANPTLIESPHLNERRSTSLNLRRLFVFSLVTVGSGCGAITLVALGFGIGGEWDAWAICLGVPVAFTGMALTGLWKLFNQHSDPRDVSAVGAKSSLRKYWKLAEWLLFGYFSSAMAIVPLFGMLLAFLRSGIVLEKESTQYFIAGAVFISLAIVLSYAASLAVLVQRTQGAPVKWGTVFAINAASLFTVVMTLGLTSRMLESVMVMASVRVENAVITLEPDGCELLESMQSSGWGRTPGKGTKTCTLYGVTIQSTLEPSMQIACWRGIVAPKLKKTESTSSSSKEIDTPTTGQEENIQSRAPSSPESTTSMAVTGNQGAFYLPVKYVRSIWKTGGLETPKDKASVCPTVFNVESTQTQVKATTAN